MTTAETEEAADIDTNKVVAEYIRLRDAKKALADRHAKEMARIAEPMRKREALLLDHLNKTHSESVRTENGTFFKVKRTSTKVVEWEACLEFILENDLWHMLERRVSKSAVEEYQAATGELPPGVAISTEVSINIRAS